MAGEVRPRLEALDGLRGIAALAVVGWHLHFRAPGGGVPAAAHAYLAVDLFFMISGFILAHAYGDRLERAGGAGGFLRARLRRLYPLYALGAVLGLIALALTGGAPPDGAGVLWLGCAAVLLPVLSGGAAMAEAFPLNPPSWSLSQEMWGALVFGAVAPRLGPRVLVLAVAISGAVLALMALTLGELNYGWRQGDVWLGWPRFAFAFCVGLGLHRLQASGRLRLPECPDWICALILAAVMAAPRAGRLNGLFDLICVAGVFPLLVSLAAGARPTAPWRAPLALAGRLSYPLYAVHIAVITLVYGLAARLGAGAPGPWLAPLALAACVGAAWAADRGFDQPVRRWLARRGARSAGRPAPAPARASAHG